MLRDKIYAYLSIVLLFAGSLLVVKSGYFYAKGVLAQILLENTWAESKKTKKIIKAWSWADTYPVGRLSIPSINFSRVVLQGTNNESLAFGPGHISSSSKPGENGNIAIVGHRDSFFRKLGQINKGEIIKLESLSTVQTYIVNDIQITKPKNTEWIENSLDNVITLITCYPFDFVGSAPKRYIVRGKII
jgi:sortase A